MTKLTVETAGIITISISHLSRQTIDAIDRCRGNIPNGPSVAVRNEGFLINSHRGSPDVLDDAVQPIAGVQGLMARHPDLVLIQAFARGLDVEWINLDSDGVAYNDVLPVYDEDGTMRPPTAEGWRDTLSRSITINDCQVVAPDMEFLRMIEAGQTPREPSIDPGF